MPIRRKIAGMKCGMIAIIAAPALLTVSSSAANQQVYEDDRISVAVPSRWSQMSTANVEVTKGWRHAEPNGFAFSDGTYALYLLTHAEQVSGIVGGRFIEIADYVAPWSDRETGVCDTFTKQVITKVTDDLSRVDLYFDARHAKELDLARCGNPSVKAVLWYGSYFRQTCPPVTSNNCCCESGYFLSYPTLAHTHLASDLYPSDYQMVFTLTFRTSNPNNLPHEGDRHLRKFLDEASEVVRSIKYRPFPRPS